MFDLEQAIVAWREQMMHAGIESPEPLAELECHLRDEVLRRVQSGSEEQAAFDAALKAMGDSAELKSEFAKVGETMLERLRRSVRAFAGIPDYQLAPNMNIPNQNLEPTWATYFKSAALIFPALFVWIGSFVFVMPKLKEICAVSGTVFPTPIWRVLVVSDFIKSHFMLGALVLLAALTLLEWRSRRWPRYRRFVFGSLAFCLNFFALALLASLLVFAVVVGANLAQHR